MAAKKELSFEDALQKLEEAAEFLRSGEGSLEKNIEVYNNSIMYYQRCDEILKTARQKIEIIRPSDGEIEEFKEYE